MPVSKTSTGEAKQTPKSSSPSERMPFERGFTASAMSLRMPLHPEVSRTLSFPIGAAAGKGRIIALPAGVPDGTLVAAKARFWAVFWYPSTWTSFPSRVDSPTYRMVLERRAGPRQTHMERPFARRGCDLRDRRFPTKKRRSCQGDAVVFFTDSD